MFTHIKVTFFLRSIQIFLCEAMSVYAPFAPQTCREAVEGLGQSCFKYVMITSPWFMTRPNVLCTPGGAKVIELHNH